MKNISLKICLVIVALFGVVSAGVASNLPPCPSESDARLHNCYGTFTWEGGTIYIGEWKDGQKNGQGTQLYGSETQWAGDKYVGQFKSGEFHGQGTYIFSSGDIYAGGFKDNQTSGQGILTRANGDRYVGQHEGGSSNGQGTYNYADGRRYVGEWKNDKKNGQGTFNWLNGDKYVGEWQDDKQNGQGSFIRANGDKYVGGFKDNKGSGQGIATSLAGTKYFGEMKDGKKNGQGTNIWADGSKYVGEWKDNKKNGQGSYTYTDGKVEKGIWEDDEFQYAKTPSTTNSPVQATSLLNCPSDTNVLWHNCFGTYTWSDGEKYVGEFKDGNFNGQGVYTHADGKVEEGTWKDDKLNGQGTYTWSDGDKYVGEFKDDKRTGQGTFKWSSGDIYVGQWRDDVKHGQGTYTYGSKTAWAGDKYVGQHKNGKRNGQGAFFFASGDQYVGEWKDGMFTGQGKKTYANGTVEEGIWKDWNFQYAKTPTKIAPVVEAPTKNSVAITGAAASPKLPSEGIFIHPECLDFLAPWGQINSDSIDCSEFDPATIQKVGNQFGVWYGDGQSIAYRYPDIDDHLSKNKDFKILEVSIDGGGTGIFSSIVLLERDFFNLNKYKVWARTPDGDRCNDGKKSVFKSTSAGFEFKAAATPFRLINPKDITDWRNWNLASELSKLGDNELERPPVFNEWLPYEDVANSANFCVGWVVRRYDYETGFEILGVELNQDLQIELASDDTSLSACINRWLVSQINEDKFYFEINDWTSRLRQLTNMCGQKPFAWVVQLGNFDNRTSAARLRDKVIRAGFSAYMVPNGALFKVLVGPELNKAKAESLQEKLKDKFKMTGMVTTYSPDSLEVTATDKKGADKKATDQKMAQQLDNLLDDEDAQMQGLEQEATNGQAVASAVNYIRNEIIQRWVRPANARTGMVVELVIHLVPTGEVVDIEIRYRDDSATDAFVASAVKAVRKVGRFDKLSQLKAGLFDANFREFNFLFKPEDLRL